MAIQDVLSRIGAIEARVARLGGPSLNAAPSASFATQLASASAPGAPTGTAGARVVQLAQSQIGQAEYPPGSNDGPAVALYRTAVAGAVPGAKWCAYFTSWVAQQAGVPLGDTGQGLGSVSQVESWARSTGKYLPAGSVPAPGDLILFGTRHIGIVESVNPDGTLTTIEGNSSDRVSRVTRRPTEATGYVRL